MTILVTVIIIFCTLHCRLHKTNDSDSNRIYNSYITKAITDIRSNSKCPDKKAITDYVIKNFATNIDELFIDSKISRSKRIRK